MKIALCFSGQPRSFIKGFDYYKRNLLDQYDVDVFAHLWKFDQVDLFKELYNPKEIMVEEPLTSGDEIDSIYTNTPNAQKYPPRFTVSAFYSMYICSLLKKTHEKQHDFVYDWVIKTRTDYALNVFIPFNDLSNEILYIPGCRRVPTKDFGNDQFAFSSSENMDKYMSTYTQLDKFYQSGVAMIGEDMMSANIKKHGLVGDKLEYCHMNNPFPPGPHNGTTHSLIRDDYDAWTK